LLILSELYEAHKFHLQKIRICKSREAPAGGFLIIQKELDQIVGNENVVENFLFC